MRSFAFASMSSRMPKSSAPAGHAFTQAGWACAAAKRVRSSSVSACPFRATGTAGWRRSSHRVHLLILGASESHSALIAPNGHAHTQYRQPMHFAGS